MKNRGFTLVELIAVIVLLGLLMALAVPNAINLMKKVTGKSYTTKIDLIEDAAQSYGLSNIGLVRRGVNPKDTTKSGTCTFNYDKDKVTSVVYTVRNYSDTLSLANTANKKEYWCMRITLSDLINLSNELSWDYENQCDGKCSDANKSDYDSIVINPDTKNIINKCYTYIYYRNNRPYAYFDKTECDKYSETPAEGHEYRQLLNN